MNKEKHSYQYVYNLDIFYYIRSVPHFYTYKINIEKLVLSLLV